jgi:hypothetical protein
VRNLQKQREIGRKVTQLMKARPARIPYQNIPKRKEAKHGNAKSREQTEALGPV